MTDWLDLMMRAMMLMVVQVMMHLMAKVVGSVQLTTRRPEFVRR